MRYITEIDAVEEFETLCVGDGVLLTGGDGLMRMEEQRLLIQSLLVSPPQSMADLRLNRLLSSQTVLWSEKFENCAHKKLIVRLPDQPIDVILPDTPAEQERLAEVMARDTKWVEEQVKALKNMNPGLSCRGCRMMIGNELLCKIFLQSSMTAAKQQGYEEVSVLIPFVSEKEEVCYLRKLIAAYAAEAGLRFELGVEIATPRAACIAEDLAENADFMIFRTEELSELLFGMSKQDSREVISHYMYENVFRLNPFVEFDEAGIGMLLTMVIEKIRSIKPEMRLGAAGRPALSEKGRNFCRNIGITTLVGTQSLFRVENVFEQEKDGYQTVSV